MGSEHEPITWSNQNILKEGVGWFGVLQIT